MATVLSLMTGSLAIFGPGVAAAAAAAYTAVDLGTLGGSQSSADDVSGAGQVVGRSVTASGDVHAFSWTATGGMVDLGTLGGLFSGAVAVVSPQQVVGDSARASGAVRFGGLRVQGWSISAPSVVWRAAPSI